MVEIRFSCCAASSAAFSCPQRPCKLLIIRGALHSIQEGLQVMMDDLKALLAMAMSQPEPNSS